MHSNHLFDSLIHQIFSCAQNFEPDSSATAHPVVQDRREEGIRIMLHLAKNGHEEAARLVASQMQEAEKFTGVNFCSGGENLRGAAS